MECPRCEGQGLINKAKVKGLEIEIYVCDECEATWLKGETLSVKGFQDFGTFMKSLGLKGLWSELTDVTAKW